jgi:sporulation protein YlmC with PRC-barrel domain
MQLRQTARMPATTGKELLIMIKKIALATAAAALLTTGALAQNTTPSTPPQTAPATPPADKQATPPADAQAPAGSMTEKKTMTEKAAGGLEFSSTTSADQMPANKLIGMSVYNVADENLGDVNDVILDKSGTPAVVVIGVGGFLGIGEKNVGVPFDRLSFSMNKDNDRVARLDVNKDTLDNAPSFVYTDEAEKTAVKTN